MEINQSNCVVFIDWRCDIVFVFLGFKYSLLFDFVMWYFVVFYVYDLVMINESGVVQFQNRLFVGVLWVWCCVYMDDEFFELSWCYFERLKGDKGEFKVRLF